MVTWTLNSHDKSHHAPDEQCHLLPLGYDDFKQLLNEWKLRERTKGSPLQTRDLITVLWWGNKAVTGQGGRLRQGFCKTTLSAHWNNNKNKTQQLSLPTSDNNQIITGVASLLCAWYFSLAFQLIHAMIKASVICSPWRPVEHSSSGCAAW